MTIDAAAAISAILRANDPLEPWLTESHWDDHYWDDEAAQIALRVGPQQSVAEIRSIVVEVLNSALPGIAQSSDPSVSARIDSIAEAIQSALGI